MKSLIYSDIFQNMMSTDNLGKVYPCIGVMDKDGKELMLGSVVQYLDHGLAMHSSRSIYRVVYQAPSFILKNEIGQIVYLDNIQTSKIKILGHIENYYR